MNCDSFYDRGPFLPRLAAGLLIFCLIFGGCETSGSLTRKKMKSVEKGLLRTVYFKGQTPEKLSLEDRMAFYRVPGVSLAVLDKYQLEWAKVYGVRDDQTRVPLTEDTLFQAGALSQPVTAAAVLHFVEEGRFDLESNVNNWLESWKIPGSSEDSRNRVNLTGLLTHSAGVSTRGFEGYFQDEILPSLEHILKGENPAKNSPVRLEFEPGSRVRDSEPGYVVLQQVLMNLENKSFPEIIRETVFNPLTMTSSTFDIPLPAEIKERAASGHTREGISLEGKWVNYPELAAKGLWTNPSDFGVFLIDIVNSAMGKSEKTLSAALARRILSPQVRDRSFGLIIDGSGDDACCRIQGRTRGFTGYAAIYPARGQGAVIMTNSDNGGPLIEEVLRAISEAYEWPGYKPVERPLYKLETSVYEQYVGRYEITPDYILSVSQEDYYLVIQPTGQAPTKFYAESETVFFSVDPYIKIQFRRDDKGRVDHLVLWQQDFEQVGKKITDVP